VLVEALSRYGTEVPPRIAAAGHTPVEQYLYHGTPLDCALNIIKINEISPGGDLGAARANEFHYPEAQRLPKLLESRVIIRISQSCLYSIGKNYRMPLKFIHIGMSMAKAIIGKPMSRKKLSMGLFDLCQNISC
jgi:hypothetical protein